MLRKILIALFAIGSFTLLLVPVQSDVVPTMSFVGIGLDANGHLLLPVFTGGAAPTVTAACGTSPSIVGSDSRFQLNVGTGGVATTCTVTFNKAWTVKPVCVVTDETSQAITTTAVPASATIVITGTAAWTASSIIDVFCDRGL